MTTILRRTPDGGNADEKAVAYIRISTANQADGYGLASQKAEIAKYIRSHPNIRLLRTYCDQGSGADLNRQNLRKLLHDAASKTFTKVLVPRTDRLSRDLYGALFIEKTLLLHSVEVVSCTEPLSGKDAVTVALRQIVNVFASLERQLIKDRCAAGRKQKFLEGRYATGRPALGYAVHNGELIVDEREADIVRQIKRWRWGRNSYCEIARRLNEAGYRTKLKRTFSGNSIKYILNNVIYRQKVRYAGEEIEATHAAIR
jgi:site-specific DNA recombinase